MKPIDCCAGVGRYEYLVAGIESNAATSRVPYCTAKNLNDMTTSFCATAAVEWIINTATANRKRFTTSPMTERPCNTSGIETIRPSTGGLDLADQDWPVSYTHL